MTLPEPIRVMIVSDNSLVYEGIQRVLESEADIAVVGVAAASEDALAHVARLRPFVILMAFDAPEHVNVRLIMAIRDHQTSGPRVLLLLPRCNDAVVLEAMVAGARGCLACTAKGLERLADAIRAVSRGELWLERRLMPLLLARVRHDGHLLHIMPLLTSREREVLELVSRGCRNREIAERLGIRVGTVKTYLVRISRKVGVHGRNHIARLCSPRVTNRTILVSAKTIPDE